MAIVERSGAFGPAGRHYGARPCVSPWKAGGFARIDRALIAVSGALMLACATTPTPVTVAGDAGDRASLAGKWTGEYSSQTTGRSGSIVFNLSPSGDAASGDVVMVPRGLDRPLTPYTAGNATVAGVQSPQASQVLTIKLVRVSGDTVTGVLDAYRDPQCDCPVVTTFTGKLSADPIDGTFTTRGNESAAQQSGTWRVTRKR